MHLTIENILLIGSLLLFVSIVVGKTSYKFGVPTLLLFLIISMFCIVNAYKIHYKGKLFECQDKNMFFEFSFYNSLCEILNNGVIMILSTK